LNRKPFHVVQRSKTDFAVALAKRVLRLALEYAVLAPSSHNTQPWLFRLNDNTVELYADAERILKTVDPHGREAVSLLPSVRRYYTLL
jgi:nitroreductase